MYINGIVFQEKRNGFYKGIDGSGFSPNTGENWYLNNIDGLERFQKYYDENIGYTYYFVEELSYVAVCNDWDYINDYIKESKEREIEYRILLCETEIPQPIINVPPTIKRKYIGYDYAYATGDYYSAVYNEIPYVFPQFKLNSSGLFETEEEIREYIEIRKDYVLNHPPCTLEIDDFIIYKLHELLL